MIGFITRFMPSVAPAVGALLNPWVWGLLLAAALGAFTLGWTVESWRWDAASAKVLENNLRVLSDFWKRQANSNQATAQRLARDRDKLDRDRRAFDERIANVSESSLVEVTCPKPEPSRVIVTFPPPADPAPLAPGPRVHLSADACKLFNDGLAVGLPDAYGRWGVDAEAACAGPVEVSAMIRVVKANAEAANKMRSQLLAWQAKACKEGWWGGDECDLFRR